MIRLHRIIQNKKKIELERMVFHALKAAYKKEEKELGESIIGKKKEFKRKVDWEIVKMKEWNKHINSPEFTLRVMD